MDNVFSQFYSVNKEANNKFIPFAEKEIIKNTFEIFSTWYNLALAKEPLRETKYISISDCFENLLRCFGTISFLSRIVSPIHIEETQFVDISDIENIFDTKTLWEHAPNIAVNSEMTTRITNRFSSRPVQMNVSSITLNIDSIELPFEEAFYKVTGTHHIKYSWSNLFLYMKECSPELYEGVVLLELKLGMYCPVPVTLQLIENKFVLEIIHPSLFGETTEQTMEEGFTVLRAVSHTFVFALLKLNKLNHNANVYRYKGETPKRKYKANGKKSYIRKPVYVYLNKEQNIPLEYTTSKLKREISWMVRGHWRRINPESIGKNARDERVVQGFTWVKPHLCGDKANLHLSHLIVKEKVN